MNKSDNTWLLTGAYASFFIALAHIAMIFGGAEWYRFFGAGEAMVRMAEQGSWFPALSTFGLAVVFSVWGLYALSGTGRIRRLPYIRSVLIIISAIYTLRGLAIVAPLFGPTAHTPFFLIWTSIISLTIGVLYALGTKKGWDVLSAK